MTDIDGSAIDFVDVITFGSPCQDLSVAGKRAGLKHAANGDSETTRSGLFMEAVRIIREMREASNGKYPRFAVWENVPGAFSSNKGEDFRVVLEELIRIVEPTAAVPAAPKGRWPYADAYVGDGWSLAYRTFDAQHWGVPQRRRRIYLVADLTGGGAPGILFEREGVRGYFEAVGETGKTTSGEAEKSPGTDHRPGDPPYLLKIRSGCEGGGKGALIQEDLSATVSTLNDQYLFQPVADGYILDDQGGSQITVRTDGMCPTLRAETHGNLPCVMQAAGFGTEHSASSRSIGYQEECVPTLRADRMPAVVYDARGNGDGEVVPTITGDHNGHISDYTAVAVEPVICLQGNTVDRDARQNGSGICQDVSHTLNSVDRHAVAYGIGNGQANQSFTEELVGALNCMHDQQAVAYEVEHPIIVDRAYFNQGANAQYDPQTYEDGKVPTLVARGPHAVAVRYIGRRLTPVECARLQGFADEWGQIERKDDLSEEEYRFWLNVRNTNAAINGKAVKEYTKAQMVRWYNKLHSKSSEYKMWGNGVALPPTLYVMQGIADALKGGEKYGHHAEN